MKFTGRIVRNWPKPENQVVLHYAMMQGPLCGRRGKSTGYEGRVTCQRCQELLILGMHW